MRGLGQEFLPEELFSLPEVGCLPAEGGAMHLPQIRKEAGVVASEVRKEPRVFIESQELTDDLDGEDFRVGECGGGSTCSEAPEILDTVVNEAEKTATIKVLRSMSGRPPFVLDGLEHHRE